MASTLLRRLLALACLPLAAVAYDFDSTAATDALAATALQNFLAYQYNDTGRAAQSCPQENIIRRREWHNLTIAERSDYVRANQCLLTLPAKTNPADGTGARTRWDDFVVTHQRMAMVIHNTGMFLAWHRLFILSWETALRDECGYTGHLPYVNWAKIAHDPIGSPLFDNSMASIGGNGPYVYHNGNQGAVPGGSLQLPAGSGGGCITTGPFANYTINTGPRDSLAYNPRCFSRDILQQISSKALTDAKTAALITNNNGIIGFEGVMQGVGNNDFATWGVHASGHNMMAGVPGGDFWISCAEPWFWVFHGMIDRVWWIWQNQDPVNRMNAVGGDRAAFGNPYNGTVQLTDMLVLNTYNLPDRQIQTMMSTVQNGLCYVYE